MTPSARLLGLAIIVASRYFVAWIAQLIINAHMMCAWFILFGAYRWVGERGQSVMVMQTLGKLQDSGGGMDKQQQSIRGGGRREIYSLFLNLRRSTYGIVCSIVVFVFL